MSSGFSSSRIRKRDTKSGPDLVYYIVSVEGERIFLTDGQLRSEPSNLLNVNPIKPGKTQYTDQDIILETDINLFRLIHAHLRGFEIFPLSPQGIPFGRKTGDNNHLLHLSPEATLKNLLRDATDFGLANLAAKIKQEMANQAKASKETKTQLGDDEAAKEFVMLD